MWVRTSQLSRGRRSIKVRTAVTLLFLALWTGCANDSEPISAFPRPNIIFLTVDTLRADHMALYGYERDTMPAIEAFAKTSVVFDNAVVPRGSTRPSYASMLTGLYPYRHGVHANRIELHADLPTLQESLKSAGYHTAAFVSNFVLIKELSGFAQGFDVYDDFVDEKETNRNYYERTGARTLAAILKWLNSGPPEPFFLFTNFIDPHGPYRPPETYREMFQSERRRGVPIDEIPPYQVYGDRLNYYDYVDRYDGEIGFTDAVLGLLIAELKSKGLWDNAIVVFTADHGESLGEHGLYFHHQLHLWEETVRVPMVIRIPGLTEPGRSFDLCSPMDLPATLYEYLGLQSEEHLNGKSLLPMLRGEDDLTRSLLIEAPRIRKQGTIGAFAIRTRTHKLIQVEDMKDKTIVRLDVYDVANDPLEQNRIAFDPNVNVHRELRTELDQALTNLWSYKLPFKPKIYYVPNEERFDFVFGRLQTTEQQEFTPDQAEQLRSLGYVR